MRSMTSTGPAEEKAMKPNEASFSFFCESTDATPAPSAIRNGTVIGPVVTPPESKQRAATFSSPLKTSRQRMPKTAV